MTVGLKPIRQTSSHLKRQKTLGLTGSDPGKVYLSRSELGASRFPRPTFVDGSRATFRTFVGLNPMVLLLTGCDRTNRANTLRVITNPLAGPTSFIVRSTQSADVIPTHDRLPCSRQLLSNA
jgi:hypothetical protein